MNVNFLMLLPCIILTIVLFSVCLVVLVVAVVVASWNLKLMDDLCVVGMRQELMWSGDAFGVILFVMDLE
jgi:hypothetical protein